MDGENNGSKSYEQMDDLGGFPTPIFGNAPPQVQGPWCPAVEEVWSFGRGRRVTVFFLKKKMDVNPKIGGKPPKMDGENNGKPF